MVILLDLAVDLMKSGEVEEYGQINQRRLIHVIGN